MAAEMKADTWGRPEAALPCTHLLPLTQHARPLTHPGSEPEGDRVVPEGEVEGIGDERADLNFYA